MQARHIDIGASAEYALASELLARGITPCWPSTETGAYDMIADTGSNLYRVQVKATHTTGRTIRMCIKRHSCGYSTEDVDLFALYLQEFDLWYIIPSRRIKRDIRIRPADPACRWHRYKEAWSQLK